MVDVLVFFEGFSRLATEWINAFARTVDALPVPYAFGAGMLSAVNPCGFIMLPSFAAFYMAARDGQGAGTMQRSLRALHMGALVTLAFVITFGLAGVVITSGGRFIMSWIGWAGFAIGVGLIALGAYQLLTHRSLFASTTANIRVERSATTRGVIVFGIAYAVASLGCTLPVFMIVVGSIFTGTGNYGESVWRFVQYAAGMGAMLTAITVGVALSRQLTVRAVSGVLPVVESAGNVALIFAGAYLVWYWTNKGGLL